MPVCPDRATISGQLRKDGRPLAPPIHYPPIIGLTGGIGSGKSTVAGLLESLGAKVIDSDRVAHEELRSPEVVDTLRSWWGPGIVVDGVVDRKALGALVFADPEKLRRLEELLYPRIHRRRKEVIDGFAGNRDVRAFVLDAPKLHEAGVDGECDAVIFVDADDDVRFERVTGSRGWSREEWGRREKLQIPLDKKRSLADYVLVNNHSDVGSLRPEIERIFDSVLKTFS